MGCGLMALQSICAWTICVAVCVSVCVSVCLCRCAGALGQKTRVRRTDGDVCLCCSTESRPSFSLRSSSPLHPSPHHCHRCCPARGMLHVKRRPATWRSPHSHSSLSTSPLFQTVRSFDRRRLRVAQLLFCHAVFLLLLLSSRSSFCLRSSLDTVHLFTTLFSSTLHLRRAGGDVRASYDLDTPPPPPCSGGCGHPIPSTWCAPPPASSISPSHRAAGKLRKEAKEIFKNGSRWS